MRHSLTVKRLALATLLLTLFSQAFAQTPAPLKVENFAIWAGSTPAGVYNSTTGINVAGKVTVKGNIGSNHFIIAKKQVSVTGDVFSGNILQFDRDNLVTGNVVAANRAGNTKDKIVQADKATIIRGNLTAGGMVEIKEAGKKDTSFVGGKVTIPAPESANYTGPQPYGGFGNTPNFAASPSMPNNNPFDNKAGTTLINTTRTIGPGSYGKIALSRDQVLTFNGPGNYIFTSVDNANNECQLVFDLKNTTSGAINIFVVGNARWGKMAVRFANGNDPARIFTEVHGNGSSNGGSAFEVSGSKKKYSPYLTWAGVVWAPNAGINIGTISGTGNEDSVNVAGSLWSNFAVNISANLTLDYNIPKVVQNFIDPYYPPPANGKVAANNIIGAELTSLSQNPSNAGAIPENLIYQVDNNKVLIEVITRNPNDVALRNQLIAQGMTGIIDNGPLAFVITGYFPINLLTDLNTNQQIVYVRPLFPPITNAGQVKTQGDETMRSDKVRERFGLDGEGVKIGVLSDSYNSKLAAQADVDEGDLPGIKSNGQANDNPTPVQVLFDYPGQKKDEGRAMLQIVHDVAPKAKLAFRTGFLTAGDFAKGIQDLASTTLPGGRCEVIVDDITYITEPFLTDGIVAQTVDQVVSQGVSYYSSAGNFGNKSYESNFQGVSNPAILPAPALLHRFGGSSNEVFQTLRLKPGNYTIVLQWSDDFYSLNGIQGVQTDLDLYLLNANNFTLFGFNRSNLFGDPFEVCPFVVKEETEAKLIVANANGTNANVRFKYIIFAGDGTIVDYQSGGSTVVGHPNAQGAIAVGAMLYKNIPAFTPIYPSVASFSSRGGTSTKSTTGGFVQRNKPEVVGPNGVNTTVNLGGPVFDDGDPYPNFFGTSAAAPHVAAVGALIIQAKKKYGLQPTVTPAEIRNTLVATAGKFAGQTQPFTFAGGYGFVQADSAVSQVANARPIVESWQPATPGTQPGTQPFEVKVKGAYFTPESKIYFRGVPLPNTTVSADKTEVTGTIPPIANTEDPPLQVFNDAKSPSGLDGGLSEALHFFSERKDVTIRANNATRKYGQQNPAFSVEILVDGLPINQTKLTPADLKLDGTNITITTLATPNSVAGLYSIVPARATPLDANDPLLAAYSFTFVQGTLVVEKMKVKITPVNQVVKYGDFINDVEYTYEFDEAATNVDGLLEQVQVQHKKYLAANALAVIQQQGEEGPVLTPADLVNMSAMASFQAVRNGRVFTLNNGRLQPLVNELSTDDLGDERFLVDISSTSLTNYQLNGAETNMLKALVNQNARGILNLKALVNGQGKAALPNGQLQPMVNGQLLAMVNGQLKAMVNGQLKAMVNEVEVDAADFIFQNGQLRALVNGEWIVITNGRLQALVNGEDITVELTVTNGRLQALVNGQLMALVNGQLQAMVNGRLLAMVNGQLQALVNGRLMPIVNGRLLAMVNGQLQPMVNGQLLAMVNGRLMALVNGQLELVESLNLSNGQLQALVNGQLQALVNGQLKAMVNGVVTDVTNPALVNGQLQALVNGRLQALVNGQLQPLVNGQLQPLVNGDLLPVSNVTVQANGQLKAMVNNQLIPMVNGQLQALVNGQLLAMVNGQLMALVNGELTFAVFSNGQLQALVNGQLRPIVNGQLQPLVNGQLQPMVNARLQAMVNNILTPVDSYNITNGQLQALVNGQLLPLVNGQLLALVNGQLQPMVNNFDVIGATNNANTVVVVDEADLTEQGGAVGGMFAVNMITGLNVGTQKLIPGAFVNENFEVTYGLGDVEILPRPLVIAAPELTKIYGEENPEFELEVANLAYDETVDDIVLPTISLNAGTTTGVGEYPITLSGGEADNYTHILQDGKLTIEKRQLYVNANNLSRPYGQPNPPLTLTYEGFANGESSEDIEGPEVNTDATTGSPAGEYLIAVSGGSASNYELIITNGTLTVNKVALNVSILGASKTYGEPNPDFVVTYDGFVNNDNVSVIQPPVAVTAANQNSGAGQYPITLEGGASDKYYFVFGQGTLVINKAPLTIRANDVSINVSEPLPAFDVQYEGLLNGDNENVVTGLQISTNYQPGETGPGTYDIILSGGSADNYELDLVNGLLNVIGEISPVITCAPDVTVDNGAEQCGAYVEITAPTVVFGTEDSREFIVNGSFGSGDFRWNDCNNLVEAFLTEADYGGSNPGNLVAEVDNGGVSLCQNLSGLTVGAKYVLSFKASRRINPLGDFFISPTVGAIISIDGGALSASVTRSNTVFQFTNETFTFTATSTTHKLQFLPNGADDESRGIIIDDISVKLAPGTLVNDITGTADASGEYAGGETNIVWTATNAFGQTATCTQKVTVMDREAPYLDCPEVITLSVNEGSTVNITSELIDNSEVVVSTVTVSQNGEGGLLSLQNDNTKVVSGSCDCPPGHAAVGFTGRVGEIVDALRLICAPILADGTPGTPSPLDCVNGGTGGNELGNFVAPGPSWLVGLHIGDLAYYNRTGTLGSVVGYSLNYQSIINNLANYQISAEMRGVFASQRYMLQRAPAGSVITGFNYHIDQVQPGPYSSTIQLKYKSLTVKQPVATFRVFDNCDGNLNVAVGGKTSFTSADQGDYPLTFTVTDQQGNESVCTTQVAVTGATQLQRSSTPPATGKVKSEKAATGKVNAEPTEVIPVSDKIFPNPATHTIRTQVTGEVRSVNQVILFDMVGKQQNVRGFKLLSANAFEMSVSHLPKGVYFMRVNTGSGQKMLRFVKQ